ncbi:MAG: hypothetical protein JXD22_15170 [Sedimentisphaerales bacterium]|nr:hypothetical protein [Sedimentisphaerales bacterium]
MTQSSLIRLPALAGPDSPRSTGSFDAPVGRCGFRKQQNTNSYTIKFMTLSSLVLLFLVSCHENQSSDVPQQFDPQVDAIAAAPLPALDPDLASKISLLSDPIEMKAPEQPDATPSDSKEIKKEEAAEDISQESSEKTNETGDEDIPVKKDNEDSGPA